MDKIPTLHFPLKFHELLSDKENSVISPYGILAVLSMAAEGASEKSLDEILSCIGIESSDELRKNVLSILEKRPEPKLISKKDIVLDPVHNKNKVVFKKGPDGAELLESFKNKMEDLYSASVEEKTAECNSALELINIVEFNGQWSNKMKRNTERLTVFTNADGSKCYPAFLTCNAELYCYKSNNNEMGFILYKDRIAERKDRNRIKKSEDLNFFESFEDFFERDSEKTQKSFETDELKVLALPYKHGIGEAPYELILVESTKPVTEELLNDVLPKMEKCECDVAVPEFTIENEFDLIPMMKQIGLESIFDENTEAFDRVASKPLYASKFKQKSETKVDENGTVAMAETFMTMCLTMCLIEKEEFIFDNPFSYFIRNAESGEILFTGKVNKLYNC